MLSIFSYKFRSTWFTQWIKEGGWDTSMACATMRLLEEGQGAAKSDFKGVEQASDFDLESREKTKYRVTWIQGPHKVIDTI